MSSFNTYQCTKWWTETINSTTTAWNTLECPYCVSVPYDPSPLKMPFAEWLPSISFNRRTLCSFDNIFSSFSRIPSVHWSRTSPVMCSRAMSWLYCSSPIAFNSRTICTGKTKEWQRQSWMTKWNEGMDCVVWVKASSGYTRAVERVWKKKKALPHSFCKSNTTAYRSGAFVGCQHNRWINANACINNWFSPRIKCDVL